MIKKNRFSLRLRTAFELWLLSLVLFSLLRTAFFFVFSGGAEKFASGEAVEAFWLGLRFDARLATLLVLPILLLGLRSSWRWSASPRARNVWTNFYAAIYTFVILIYAFDFGYYSYLQSRINITIFQFLRNPLISAQMLYESYNLFLWVPVVLVGLFALYSFFRRHLFAGASAEDTKLSIGAVVTQGVVATLMVLASLWGSASQYPLRWSEAFFTQNMFVAYLAMNPVHYMADSIESRKQTYNLDKVKEYYPAMAKYLGVTNTQDLNFQRPVDSDAKDIPQFKAPNIVYIVMESMAAYKTGVFKNAPDSSPSLDRLANEGWLFRNYYTPTEGTARSLFCVLSGIPDINAKSTSSRNPLIVNQNTLINALEGYEKYYFIGGSATWGNIRGVYMNNISGLQMYEGDSNLGGPRTDVWGLSDLDLFRQTAKVLAARDQAKPFFALIQSASFHRPYTIPPEHGDYKMKMLSPEELENLGFASNEEYNSFRLADYSLGEFFRLIKNDEFFKNTIFVIHGDHGLPHNGAHHLADGYKFYGLNRFHVPLVFYSPLFREHKEFNVMMSETDVWPTLMGLIGKTPTATTLGRNVLALPKDQPHYAFSYVYYSDPLQIMLYDQNFIAFGTEKHIDGLYKYMTPDYKTDVSAQYPGKFKEMSDLLMGMFETSKYILYHNPRLTKGAVETKNN